MRGSEEGRVWSALSIERFARSKVRGVGAMSGNWKNAAGHAKFVQLFEHPDGRFELGDDAKSFSWWCDHFRSARTFKFPYECSKCGYRGAGTTMANVVRTSRAKCMCKESCQVSRYPTQEFHCKFLEVVSQNPRCDAGPLMEFAHWTSTVRSSQQLITLTCTACAMTNSRVLLKNFMKNGTFGCFCNGTYEVKTEEARQYVLRVLQCDDHPFSPGPGVFDAHWWNQNVANSHSKIEVICSVCQMSTWVGISQFVTRGQRALCGCKWKTETLVTNWFFEFVQNRFPNLEAVRQYSHAECTRRQRYRFDLALKDPRSAKALIAIEIDGPQHFCASFGKAAFEDTLQRDWDKEKWCVANGIPLVRISQRSAWYNRFDWKAFIAKNVEMAVDGRVSGVVVEPNCVAYVSGRYASVRV